VKQHVAPIENDLRGLLRALGAMQSAVEPFPIDTRRPGGTMLYEERAADVARAIDDMVRSARR